MGRILHDYHEAGSVNALLAIWGFVDDTTFLTKAGHVGVVYRLRGIDYEGLTHDELQALVHRFEAALRLLDEHCRLYQYLVKRMVAPFHSASCSQPVAREAVQRRTAHLNGLRPELYDIELYLALVFEPPARHRSSTELRGMWRHPRRALRAWLSTHDTLTLLEAEEGDSLVITCVRCRGSGGRLQDLGLFPGTEITVVRKIPGNGIVVRVKECDIALSPEVAAFILVERAG